MSPDAVLVPAGSTAKALNSNWNSTPTKCIRYTFTCIQSLVSMTTVKKVYAVMLIVDNAESIGSILDIILALSIMALFGELNALPHAYVESHKQTDKTESKARVKNKAHIIDYTGAIDSFRQI